MAENQEMFEDACTFIKTKGKCDGSTITLNQTDYKEFAAKAGVPVPMQDKIHEVNSNWMNASIAVATELCRDQVPVLKKEGRDPNTAEGMVKTMRPDGKDEVTVVGSKTFPNPQNPGTPITKYGHISIKASRTRMINEDAVSKSSETMRKLLG